MEHDVGVSMGEPEQAGAVSIMSRHIRQAHHGTEPHEHEARMHPASDDDLCPHLYEPGVVCFVEMRSEYEPAYRVWWECEAHGYICDEL